MSDAARALVVFTDELDLLAARVKQGFPDEVTCRKGCQDCCHQQVAVMPVEAARIATLIATLAPDARAALAATVRRATTGDDPPDVCGALDDDGGCQIYAGRPVVCRTHGLIYAYRTPRALGFARSCALNFRHDAPVPLLRLKPPARDDLSYVHDSDAGSDRLRAIDRAFANEHPPEGDAPATLNQLFIRLL